MASACHGRTMSSASPTAASISPLFAIESARALYYRAISEAQVEPPLEAVQRARAAHVTVQRAVVTVTQEAIRVCGGRAFLKRYPLERYARDARRGTHAPVDPGDRDAAGLGGRAWLGGAARRCRRGVTALPSVARETAQPYPRIATRRADAVASPPEQPPRPLYALFRRSICATPAAPLPRCVGAYLP